MNFGRLAVAAGFLVAAVGGVAVEPVDAAPMPGVRTLLTSGLSGRMQQVRCNCTHHVHRRRYVRRDAPDDVTPLYPAPPVGFTFRKLFDLGYF